MPDQDELVFSKELVHDLELQICGRMSIGYEEAGVLIDEIHRLQKRENELKIQIQRQEELIRQWCPVE